MTDPVRIPPAQPGGGQAPDSSRQPSGGQFRTIAAILGCGGGVGACAIMLPSLVIPLGLFGFGRLTLAVACLAVVASLPLSILGLASPRRVLAIVGVATSGAAIVIAVLVAIGRFVIGLL